MSLFTSFLTADTQLTHDGFRRLGSSLGGVIDKTFWFDQEDGAVAEGHELFGDDLQRYQVSGSLAEDTLFAALVSIRRSQFPHWTLEQCQENAMRWAQHLGFAPVEEDDNG